MATYDDGNSSGSSSRGSSYASNVDANGAPISEQQDQVDASPPGSINVQEEINKNGSNPRRLPTPADQLIMDYGARGNAKVNNVNTYGSNANLWDFGIPNITPDTSSPGAGSDKLFNTYFKQFGSISSVVDNMTKQYQGSNTSSGPADMLSKIVNSKTTTVNAKLSAIKELNSMNNTANEFGLKQQANTRANVVAAANIQNKQDYLKIAQTNLGINLEKFGMFKYDKQREYQIQDGMMSAAQDGGYEGVIDYLKAADPERAIKMHAEKLKLDDQMMKNDVMKAQIPSKIAEAQTEGYGIMGKLFSGLLNVKPEERDAAYQLIRPMWQKINPDAPDHYNADVETQGMLAISQATPANILFKAKNDGIKFDSSIGKLNGDRMKIETAAAAQGISLRNHPEFMGYNNVLSQIDKTNQQKQLNNIRQTQAETSINSSNSNVINKYNKTLQDNSKDFIAKTAEIKGIVSAIQVLQQDPNNPTAQVLLAGYLLKTWNKGSTGEFDFARGLPDASFRAIDNWLKQQGTGRKVFLSPGAIADLSAVVGNYKGVLYKAQLEGESKVLKSISDSGLSLVDPKGQPIDIKKSLILPSELNKSIYYPDAPTDEQRNWALSNAPPAALEARNEAIANGMPPAEADTRLYQGLKSQQPKGQQ